MNFNYLFQKMEACDLTLIADTLFFRIVAVKLGGIQGLHQLFPSEKESCLSVT